MTRSKSIDSYKSVESATLSGRLLEARALTNAAARLALVRQNWGAEGCDALLNDALRFNQQLWTLFQAELTSDQSLLPEEVRRNLLALSAFIDKRTFDTLSYPEISKLDILININNNIAAGLMEKGEG
jgi:flagellar protein FlaF